MIRQAYIVINLHLMWINGIMWRGQLKGIIMKVWLCLIGALVALPSAVLMISQLFWLMDIHWLQHASMHSSIEFSLLTVLAAVAIYGGLKCMDVARRL